MNPTIEQRRERAERLLAQRREVRRWAVSGVELREDGTGLLDFRGHAAVFETPYEVNDWLGTYEETIAPGAFTKTLREQADVRFLINHDDLPLARTKSGTMQLSEDSIGLAVRAGLDPSDPDVARIRPKMARRDLDEMSFAFRAIRQEWNADYTQRRLLEVALWDVSIVTFPANPAASDASLRAADLFEALAAMEQEELVSELRSASRAATPEAIRRVQQVLEQLLVPQAPDPVEAAEPAARSVPLAVLQRELDLLKSPAA